jgi:hypothetical protein
VEARVVEAYNFPVEEAGMERLWLDHNSGCDIQPRLDDDARDLPERGVDMGYSDDAVVVVVEEVPRGYLQGDESDVPSEEEDLEAHYFSATEKGLNSYCWICWVVRCCC